MSIQNRIKSLLTGRYGPIANTPPPEPAAGTTRHVQNIITSKTGEWMILTNCARDTLLLPSGKQRLIKKQYIIKTFYRRKCLRYQVVATEQEALDLHKRALAELTEGDR